MCFSQMLFIIMQSCLLVLLIIHDWIDLAPFNDLRALHAEGIRAVVISTMTNCTLIAFALVGTLYFGMGPLPGWFSYYLFITYALPLLGGFMLWYRPMLFGSKSWNKEHFKKMYAHTHHLISGSDEDVRPNTLRLVIHFFIVVNAVLAFCKVLGRF